MQFIHTQLDGVTIVELDPHRDERGFLVEAYRQRDFVEHGIRCDFVQDNHSRSAANVLRGIHYQDMTAPMAKLVRCTVGSILDVVVDLRVGAPSFGQWIAVELSAENMRCLFVPVGFGHGLLTRSVAEVQYRCSGYYAPSSEGTIRWNDPDLAIDWPVEDPTLSARDRVAPLLTEYLRHPAFTDDQLRASAP